MHPTVCTRVFVGEDCSRSFLSSLKVTVFVYCAQSPAHDNMKEYEVAEGIVSLGQLIEHL